MRRLTEVFADDDLVYELAKRYYAEIMMPFRQLIQLATLVLAAPAVLVGPHPAALYAANVATVLKPKLKHVAVIGSYCWGNKVVDELTAILSKLKVEVLPPVVAKGLPKPETWQALNDLAATIAARHQPLALA